MTLLFSGDGKDGSSSIRQNAQFWLGKATEVKSFNCDPHNSLPHAWIQVVSGSVTVGETILEKADGLAIEYLDQSIELICDKDTTFFFFRLTSFL